MTDAERRVFAASRARDLCVSLRRAFVGPRAVARLRAGETAALERDELQIALGLAWADGDIELIRSALAVLPPDQVELDPVLATFQAEAANRAVMKATVDQRAAGRTERRI